MHFTNIKWLTLIYCFLSSFCFIVGCNSLLLLSFERVYGVFGHTLSMSILLAWYLYINKDNKIILLATFITFLLILIPAYIVAIGDMPRVRVDYKEINRTISECNLVSINLSLITVSIAIFLSRVKVYFVLNIFKFFISSLAAILLLHALVICAYLIIYGVAPSTPSIYSILQTNVIEAYEYVLSKGVIVRSAAIALIIAMPLFGLFVFKFQTNYLSSSNASFKATTLLILIASFILLSLNLDRVYSTYISVWRTANEQNQFKEAINARANMLKDLDLNLSGAEDGLFVVVIGESLNRDYMSLYGFEKDTTPWQRSKLSEPNFYTFYNSYSCHVHTSFALSKALTALSQYNSRQISMAECPSIIEIAKAYGFEVSWISNQAEFGFYEGPQTIIASGASNKIYLNKYNFDHSVRSEYYDDITIPYFRNVLNSNAKKKLVFVHLIGQHAEYKSRYPNNFSQWGDENPYINSILFNDSVIKQLYDLAKESKSFKAFVYFSDHGEDPSIGHTSEAFTYPMARIPFWIALSEIYAKENSDVIEAIKDNQEKHFTNDLLFDAICGLTNMTSHPFYRSSLDITSKHFELKSEDVMIFNTHKVIDDPMFKSN